MKVYVSEGHNYDDDDDGHGDTEVFTGIERNVGDTDDDGFTRSQKFATF